MSLARRGCAAARRMQSLCAVQHCRHVLHAPGMRALSGSVRRCASWTEAPARPAEPFVVTTPLYYANDVPHIGSAYSTIVADVMARYQRLRGRPVCFVTGTDEHGEKIAQAAESKGLPPSAHCDAVAAAYLRLWDRLDISYDSFVRTTDPAHCELVKRALEEVGERGDVFRGVYSGLYCVGCEEYKDAAELTPYCLCPVHLRPCSERHEDNYFFRLSRHREAVLDFVSEENPGAILPLPRANEARAAAQAGLADFSISRAHATWGVPLPQDASQTVYVWFDALLGYLSALLAHHQGRALSALEWKRRTEKGGTDVAVSAVDTYPSPPSASSPASFSALRQTLLEAGWPASVQVVGKDILRFHAVYWPGMLDALGLPPPRTLVAHGLLTRDGHKMSKSLGNSVDPHQLLDAFGCEAVRFFLIAQAALGTDGDLSERRLQASVNAVLANGLGNLLHRALCLLQKLQELPDGGNDRASDGWILRRGLDAYDPSRFPPLALLRDCCVEHAALSSAAYESLQLQRAVEGAAALISRANVLMNDVAPWKAAAPGASPDERERALAALVGLVEAARVASALLEPVVPRLAARVRRQLGLQAGGWATDSRWGTGPQSGSVLPQPQPVFARLDGVSKDEARG